MGSFAEQVIRSFEAGRRARLEEQEQARREKLEELAQQDRKAQMEHLKFLEQMSKLNAAQQARAQRIGEWHAMQGQVSGPQVPISTPRPPMMGPGPATPAGTAEGPLPNFPIPGVPAGPGVPEQPGMSLPMQNRAEFAAQQLANLAAKARIEAQARQEAESFTLPVDLPGLPKGSRVNAKEAGVAENLFNQQQANWRATQSRIPGMNEDPNTPENQDFLEKAVVITQSGLLKPTEMAGLIGGLRDPMRKAFGRRFTLSPNKPIPPALQKTAQAFAKTEAMLGLLENGGTASVPSLDNPNKKEIRRLPGILEVSKMPLEDRIKWSYIWDSYVKAHGAEIARAYGDVGNISIVERTISTQVFPGWRSINFAPGLAQDMLATLKTDVAQRKQASIDTALSTLSKDPTTGKWNVTIPGAITESSDADFIWDGTKVVPNPDKK